MSFVGTQGDFILFHFLLLFNAQGCELDRLCIARFPTRYLTRFTVRVGRNGLVRAHGKTKLRQEIPRKCIAARDHEGSSVEGNFIAHVQVIDNKMIFIVWVRLGDAVASKEFAFEPG